MFCINVALGSTSWRLLFREEKNAETAFELLNPTVGFPKQIRDDFGQKLLLASDGSVHAVMFEDLDQTKMAHIEMALHQARTQNAAQKMAATDPALRAGSNQAGPAIISPMPNGGFRPS